VDGYIDGNPQMASFLYNQVEQSYMLGYLAGLITESSMPGANADLKIGMIVAQEYPVMNKMLVPGFLKGAKAVNSSIEMDYRVVGNWYDANKAAELAKSMIDAGVDVIGVIAGGAAPGVFDAAKERGKYVMFWDGNAYSKAPGVVAGCAAVKQSKLVYEVVNKAINGTIEYGKGHVLSAKDGYIEFISDDPDYEKTVPQDIREKQQEMVNSILDGSLVLEAPQL
jgi:simple sugar transport system substrate-binding protein